MKIVINGDPIPQKRPKSSHRHGYFRTYDSQKLEKTQIQKIMLSQKTHCQEIELEHALTSCKAAIEVRIVFYVFKPKSLIKSKKTASNSISVFPCTRPDLDNYAKFYLDCGNGILWKDDSQIVSLNLIKKYSQNLPFTEIWVMPIDPKKFDQQLSVLSIFDKETFKNFMDDINYFVLFRYRNLDEILEDPNLQKRFEEFMSQDIHKFAKKYASKLDAISKIEYEYQPH